MIAEQTGMNWQTPSLLIIITFSQDSVIPSKEIRVYPNNKPWVTKDLKMHLNEKKRAQGDSCKVKMMNKEFRSRAKTAKIEHKNKVEKKVKDGN